MSFENPLDKIKKMNAENAAKKAQEAAQVEEQEVLNQKNIDEQYDLVQQQKEGYSEQVIQLKERISAITGTQKEMIAQYRTTIDEAKKDPETLQYVRDNFEEIFAEGKKKWKEAGSEKLEDIESQKGFEESIADLDSQLEELLPETTEGKNAVREQKYSEIETLYSNARKNSLNSAGRYEAPFWMTFEQLNKKASLEEIEAFLADQKEYSEISPKYNNLDSHNRKQYNEWQEEHAETIKQQEAALRNSYSEAISAYTQERDPLLTFEFPAFEELPIKSFSYSYDGSLSFDFDKALNETAEISSKFENEMYKLDKQIKEKEDTLLKRGLGKLKEEYQAIEGQNENFKKHKQWNILLETKKQIEKKFLDFFKDIKEGEKRLPYQAEQEITRETKTIGQVFEAMKQDKSFSNEELEIIEKHNELFPKMEEYREKLR